MSRSGRSCAWTPTPVETIRSSARSAAGHNLWYSGKHHRHGGNVQALTDPSGFPVWTSPVEPGSVHDLTAARTHAFPALYPVAVRGLPVLADKSYTGAGIGVHVPAKGSNLCPDTRARNLLVTALRAPTERSHALLKSTWKVLRRVTVCPWRIGHVTAAALVLTTMQRGRR